MGLAIGALCIGSIGLAQNFWQLIALQIVGVIGAGMYHPISTALAGREGRFLEKDVLPKFLPLQRWFAAKDSAIKAVTVTQLAELDGGRHTLASVNVEIDGETQRYFLPFSAVWGEETLSFGAPTLAYTLAKLRRGAKVGALIDGAFDATLPEALLAAIRRGDTVEADEGSIVFRGNDLLAETLDGVEALETPHPIGVEQSNVSIMFGDTLILKF